MADETDGEMVAQNGLALKRIPNMKKQGGALWNVLLLKTA